MMGFASGQPILRVSSPGLTGRSSNPCIWLIGERGGYWAPLEAGHDTQRGWSNSGGYLMKRRNHTFRNTLLAATMLASPAFGADVTPERLLNPDKEPQNWLMNHRTYDGQRFSPLARINRDNVKNLKFAYAVPLAGTNGREFIEATPLAEDGFLYITDSWGVLYKIDATAGDVGRIVWRMDPKQDRQVANRGAALWGNLVVSPTSGPARIVATDKSTGKVVWETNVSDAERIT